MKDHIRYLTLSRTYLKAASELSANGGQGHRFPVPHYLVGHALELVLKAHLVHGGAHEVALKNVGHDLARALKRAGPIMAALLQPEQVSAIEWLSPFYAGKELEYPKWGGAGRLVRVPDVTYLVDAVDVIYRHLDRIYRAEVRGQRKTT